MQKTQTVFVLGAGASFEVGLPVGKTLKKTIASKLDIRYDHWTRKTGEAIIDAALKLHVQESDGQSGNINDYLQAGWHIRDAIPQALSIDNFIDQQNDEKIELCGKLGIVNSILEAERSSLLSFDEHAARKTIDFDRLDQMNAWHNQFFSLLTDGCRIENVASRLSTVSFISFNYDRCLEHFLFHALKNYYRAPDNKVAEILSSLNVYHPYGSVGALPWQTNYSGISYGDEIDTSTLLTQARQIKTFTERVDDTPFLSKARQVMKGAQTVVFLGFAYHQQNLKLLDPGTFPKDDSKKRIFGTAHGISDSDCAVVKQDVANLLGVNPQSDKVKIHNNLTCNALFTEYSRSLTLK